MRSLLTFLLSAAVVVTLTAAPADDCVNCPGAGSVTIAVTNTNDSGTGSLRQAIICANDAPALDLITFAIPGPGPHFITLESELPPVTDQGTVIDATTQPGWTPGHVYVGGDQLTGNTTGLRLNADETELYGIYLYGFTRAAVELGANTSMRDVTIGAAGKANVLSCQPGTGTVIQLGSPSQTGGSNIVIEHNYLGVHPDGTPLGGRVGIDVWRSGPFVRFNEIAHLTESALVLNAATVATFSENEVFCVGGTAIVDNLFARGRSPQPIMDQVTTDGVGGLAGEDAVVEVYVADSPCAGDCGSGTPQGNLLLGKVTADFNGFFVLDSEDFLFTPALGARVTATGFRQGTVSSYAACAPLLVSNACADDDEAPQVGEFDLDGQFNLDYDRLTASSEDCSLTLTLPETEVTDNCDEELEVSVTFTSTATPPEVFGPYAPGGTVSGIPPGVYNVTYAATDAAGNTGTRTRELRLTPPNLPNPQCPAELTVTLGPGADACTGEFLLSYRDFLPEPNDPCGRPIAYALRRAADVGNGVPQFTAADTALVLNCEDIGVTTWRAFVYDPVNGGFNSCSFALTVLPGACQGAVPQPELTCGQPTTSSVTFNWTADAAAADYFVRTGPGPEVAIDSSTLTVAGLSPGESLTLYLRAVPFDGCGDVVDSLTCTAATFATIDYTVTFPGDRLLYCGELTEDDLGVSVQRFLNCGSPIDVSLVSVDTLAGNDTACFVLRATVDVINACEYDGVADPVLLPPQTSDLYLHVLPGDDPTVLTDDRAFLDDDGNRSDPGTELEGYAAGARGYFRYTMDFPVSSATPPDFAHNLGGTYDVVGDDCTGDVTFQLDVVRGCREASATPPEFLIELNATDRNGDGMISPVDFEPDMPQVLTVDRQANATYTLRDLPPGEHILEIRVSGGCDNGTSRTIVFTVAEPPVTDPVCAAAPTVALTADAPGCAAVATELPPDSVYVAGANCRVPDAVSVYRRAATEVDGFVPAPGVGVLLTCADLGDGDVVVYTFTDGAVRQCQTTLTVTLGPGASCVDPAPAEDFTAAAQCAPTGSFDLTRADATLLAAAPGGGVAWYTGPDATVAERIGDPTDYVPAAAPFTVLARVATGGCTTEAVAVTFVAEPVTELTFPPLPDFLCVAAPPFALPPPNEDVAGEWTTEGGLPVTVIDPAGLTSGQQIKVEFVTTDGSCTATYAHTVTLTPALRPALTDPGATVCRDSIVQITYAGADAGALEYSWSSVPAGLLAPGAGPSANFRYDADGVVTVSLTVSRDGCTSETVARTFSVGPCDPCTSLIDCVPQQGQLASVVILDTQALVTTPEVCLPVLTDGFADVVEFGFSTRWDPAVLSYARIANVNPAFAGLAEVDQASGAAVAGINVGAADAGLITVYWSAVAPGTDCTTAPAATVADQAVLFELCLTPVQSGFDVQTDVSFTESPQPSFLHNVFNCTGPAAGSLATFPARMGFAVDCDDPDNILLGITDDFTQPGCGRDDNGAIGVFAQGVSPGFTFAWSTGDTTAVVRNLGAGAYVVTVTDAAGCTDSLTTNLVQQPVELTCPDDRTESVTLETTSVTYLVPLAELNGCSQANVSYAITGASSTTGLGPIGVFDFAVGTSTVTYTLGEGSCSFNVTFTPPDNPDCNAVSLNPVAVDAPQCAEMNGRIIVEVLGGSENYTTTWTDGATGLERTELDAGFYFMNVVDENTECSFSLGFHLRQSSPVELSCATTDVTLPNAADGTADLTFANAAFPIILSYEGPQVDARVLTVPGIAQWQFTGLTPGAYEFKLTDDNGCEATCRQIVAEQLCAPVAGVQTDTTLCTGETLAFGGRELDQAGLYLDTLASAGGCDSIVSLALSFFPNAELELTGEPTVCGADGTTLLTASGATGYVWTGNGQTYTGATVSLPAGSYTLTAETAAGCPVALADEIVVTAAAPPGITLPQGAEVFTCPGQPVSLSAVLGPEEEAVWRSDPDGLEVATGATTPDNLVAGAYQLVVTNVATGCTADTLITVTERDARPAFTYCPPDQEVLLNRGEASSVDVGWAVPQATSDCGTVFDFSGMTGVEGLTRDTTVTVTAASAGGLADTCSFTVRVRPTADMTFYVATDRVQRLGADTLLVPVGVTDFTNTYSFQSYLRMSDLDGAGRLLPTVFPLHPVMGQGLDAEPLTDQALNLVWLPDNLNPVVLPDSTLLFALMVVVDGAPGACVDLGFAGVLPEVTLAFQAEGEVYASTVGGSVCLPAVGALAGKVVRLNTSFELEPVPGVAISVAGGGSERDLVTAADGSYVVPEVLLQEDYAVTPLLNRDHRNGLSILDAVIIRNIILNQPTNVSPVHPYQYVAANVQGTDCRISIGDLLAEIRMISGVWDTFRSVNSYEFVTLAHQFPALETFDDFGSEWCDFPRAIDLRALPADSLGNDLVAIKMGDPSLNSRDPAPSATGTVSYPNVGFRAGDTLRVALTYGAPLVAADVTFRVDPRYLRPVAAPVPPKAAYTANDFTTTDGPWVRQVWTDLTGHAELTLVAHAAGTLHDALRLDPGSRGADADGRMYTLIAPASAPPKRSAVRVVSYPNPFRDAVTVEVTTPERAAHTLTVRNAVGQVVLRRALPAGAAVHRLRVGSANWPAGMYTVSVRGAGGTTAHKIVKP